MTLIGCGVYAQRLEDDKAQLKEDVRRLMNTIDDEGDTDKYLCGPDYVERLWKWLYRLGVHCVKVKLIMIEKVIQRKLLWMIANIICML